MWHPTAMSFFSPTVPDIETLNTLSPGESELQIVQAFNPSGRLEKLSSRCPVSDKQGIGLE